MKHLTAYHMLGFRKQLQKEAGVSQFVKSILSNPSTRKRVIGEGLTTVGKGLMTPALGPRMLVSGVAGAGIGAATGEKGERLQGALKGGLLGAGIGGGAFLATKPGREMVKNWGRRQRYYVTGKGVKDLDEARRLGLVQGPMQRPVQVGPLTDKQSKGFEKAHKMQKAEEEAFNKDYLSVPGMLHGVLSGKGRDVLRSGWQRQGTLGKAFMGLGALEAGQQVMRPSQSGEPGRAARTLGALGQSAGWLVAPHAMLPGMLTSSGLGAASKTIGKGVDLATRRVAPPTAADSVTDY